MDKKLFNVKFSISEDIKLTLHIGKTSSEILYKKNKLKTLKNDILSGFASDKEGENIEVYLKEKELYTGSKYLCKLDTFFDDETFVDIKKDESNSFIDILFDELKVGILSLADKELQEIFRLRDNFKGRVFGDSVQIIRCAFIHQHTEYSFGDSIISVKKAAEKYEYAAAITDHGNMHGVYQFYKEMKKRGKKPIIGCEVYVETFSSNTIFDESKMDIEYSRENFHGDHMLLLAMDNEGLRNLNKIVSEANNHFYKHPNVTFATLRKYSKGIIATTACMGGTLSRGLERRNNALRYVQELYVIKSKKEDDEAKSYCYKHGLDLSFYLNLNLDDIMKATKDIWAYETKKTKAFLDEMESIFTKENFYLEIQRHKFEEEERLMNEVLKVARALGYKIVFGIDSHYPEKQDSYYHEVWRCIKNKISMDDPKRHSFNGTGYHIHTVEETVELFKDLPDALNNSLEIADKCNVTMESNGYHLPKFPLNEEDLISDDDKENQKEYFLKKVREGYRKHFAGTKYFKDKEYLDRIQYEIDIITKMGFESYFTIVSDFIAWAEDEDVFSHWRDYFPKVVTNRFLSLIKEENDIAINEALQNLDKLSKEDILALSERLNDEGFTRFVETITKDFRILVGPGRGSAAGSLIAYCLGIVKIDPIPYDLLFERFLNPDRISMPDVDVDFEDAYRENVINYTRVKYGDSCVSRIATFGTAAARAIVKDIIRVTADFNQELEKEGLVKLDEAGNYYFPDYRKADDRRKTLRAQFGNMVAKTIPQKPGITLSEALEESPDFKELYDKDFRVKQVVDNAKHLEGLSKNLSIHACGVLITDKHVSEYMPEVLIENEKLSALKGEKVKQWSTQFQAPECESMGTLKMDFLGLRTLGVIQETTQLINERINCGYYDFSNGKNFSEGLLNEIKNFSHLLEKANKLLEEKRDNLLISKDAYLLIKETLNKKTLTNFYELINVKIIFSYLETENLFISTKLAKEAIENQKMNFDLIPLNDTEVYKFISTGQTEGVFQIESPYMRSLMTDLYQDCDKEYFNGNIGFERLCDANALGRPGPMKEIPNYISNMLNPDEVEYDVPEMEAILKSTNGIIVYQEQMIKICKVLAKFSGGQADTLRKGCAKKIDSILKEYREYFIYGSVEKNILGCVGNGISEEIAISIWDKLEDFGKYAFNKSHSVAYSVNSIRTAWLSWYFPVEYFTAVLNSFVGSADKVKLYLAACRQRDIAILPPSLNKSYANFHPEGNGIRFGLYGIKNVGKASDIIINERNENGSYANLFDFILRYTRYESLKKNVMEALIYSGTLDEYEGTRLDKLNSLSSLSEIVKEIRDVRKNGQLLITDFLNVNNDYKIDVKGKEIPKQQKLSKEYEYAGFYITEHPLDGYKHYMKGKNLSLVASLKVETVNEEELDDSYEGVKQGDYVSVMGIVKGLDEMVRRSDGAKFARFRIEDASGDIEAVSYTKVYKAYRQNIVEDNIAIFRCRVEIDDYGVKLIVMSVGDIVNADMSMNIRNVYLLGSDDVNIARQQYRKVKELTKDSPGFIKVFFKEKKVHEVGEMDVDIDVLYQLYDIMNGEHNVTVNHYAETEG